MKKKLLSITLSSLMLFPIIASAHDGNYNQDRDHQRNFSDIKNHILFKINKKEENMEKMKNCVLAANDFDNLKRCHELLENRHHNWNRGDEHREWNKNRERHDGNRGDDHREYHGWNGEGMTSNNERNDYQDRN